MQRFREAISHEEDKRYRAQKGEKPFTRLLLNSLTGGQMWDMANISSKLKEFRPTAFFEAYNHFVVESYLGSTINQVQALITPAGSFHLSLMFGPLIFETGVPG